MKKLIIVCEDKFKKHGEYLKQLISENDDTEDSVVGTKDGEVSAILWSEKDYTANLAKLASEQYVLFIGNDKFIKEKCIHMNEKFSKYGMKYSWLGKQATLCVEKVVHSSEYDEFIEFALKYQSNLERLIKQKKDKKDKKVSGAAKAGAVGAAGVIGAANAGAIGTAGVISATTVGIAGLASVVPVVGLPIAGVAAFKKISKNNKIIEQQYSCVIMKFYLEAISDFLEIK